MLMSRQSRLGSGSDADHATDTLSMTRFRKVDPESPVAPRAGSVPVAHPRDIAEIRTRIAKATLDCNTWRAAGFSEKYLEACSLMEALEVEMKALGGARVSAQTREVLHNPDGPAVSPPVTSITGDREQLMAELSIAYDGVRYYYDSYRYDRLDDAVNYARLQRSRAANQAWISMPTPAIVGGPGDSDRRTMASSGITYEAGVYRLGEYRYDRLDDALAHARLRHTPLRPGGTL
jgi:hypothetical protein